MRRSNGSSSLTRDPVLGLAAGCTSAAAPPAGGAVQPGSGENARPVKSRPGAGDPARRPRRGNNAVRRPRRMRKYACTRQKLQCVVVQRGAGCRSTHRWEAQPTAAPHKSSPRADPALWASCRTLAPPSRAPARTAARAGYQPHPGPPLERSPPCTAHRTATPCQGATTHTRTLRQHVCCGFACVVGVLWRRGWVGGGAMGRRRLRLRIVAHGAAATSTTFQ